MGFARRPLLAACVLACTPLHGEVVFSGRTYRQSGRSYAQLWTAASGSAAAPLSNSARHHRMPACSPDGRAILFLSGAGPVEEWTYRELWRFDRTGGAEKLLARLPANRYFESVLGAAKDGSVLAVTAGEGGTKKALSRVRAGAVTEVAPACAAALSPDGTRLAYLRCEEPDLWLADAAGGKPVSLGPCGPPSWSPGGGQLACASQDAIRIFEARTRREVRKVPFGGAPRGRCFAWSPDGTRFLCAATGAQTNSTSPYSDYWLFDLPARTWQALPEGGNQAVWDSASRIAFVTPRELKRMGGGARGAGVWTTQLRAVDLRGLAVATLASGLAYNADPAPCPPAPVKQPGR